MDFFINLFASEDLCSQKYALTKLKSWKSSAHPFWRLQWKWQIERICFCSESGSASCKSKLAAQCGGFWQLIPTSPALNFPLFSSSFLLWMTDPLNVWKQIVFVVVSWLRLGSISLRWKFHKALASVFSISLLIAWGRWKWKRRRLICCVKLLCLAGGHSGKEISGGLLRQ